jgi:dipeptidase E
VAGVAVFVPFAAVTLSYDEYASLVKEVFSSMGIAIQSAHASHDPVGLVREASAVVVGGGNTFALLNQTSRSGVMEAIRGCVAAGTPYVGWSAGANLACPTIKTTNDMPIVEPPTLNAVGLIPFQINPHYTNYKAPGHGGETRQQRIEEYMKLNDCPVVGLPEGMLIEREESVLTLRGEGKAMLFRPNQKHTELPSGADLSGIA